MTQDSTPRPRVVILGGGFGGLRLARQLRTLPVDVTLVDRANHHLFQPLLYQVALAGLSPADIAVPIRSILRKAPNVRVLMAEATAVHLAERQVELHDGARLPYDKLVLAVGAQTAWFGHPEWARIAFGMKTIDDALDIRSRVLLAFEAAERETDPAKREELLTFVVIGGGATGVEVAGTLAELSAAMLARDFRILQGFRPRVLLVEATDQLLPAFDPALRRRAVEQLRELGVEVLLGTRVQNLTAEGVDLPGRHVEASTIVWAAGVQPSPLGRTLGTPVDRSGRVVVQPDCSVPDHPEVFTIGDLAHFDQDGVALPGLAPVAIQQADHVASCLAADLQRKPRPAFRYRDKGIMATIGRSRAVAQSGPLRLSGLLAWLAWLFIHLMYLVGFRTRVMVLLEWFWQYVTFRRGARLITGRPATHEPPQELQGVLALTEGPTAHPEAPAGRLPPHP